MQETIAERMRAFRERCAAAGLALTHQRLIIYEALASSMEHPTPEAVYERVKKRIPSMSLATVYKSVRTFADHGLLREVNVLHESLRLDANLDPHHHLICVRCKRVADLPAEAVEPVRLRRKLPSDFNSDRVTIEFHGLCARCKSDSASSTRKGEPQCPNSKGARRKTT
ncbi:MAG: transcriptional repressor [Bryobacteraceae bacterium]